MKTEIRLIIMWLLISSIAIQFLIDIEMLTSINSNKEKIQGVKSKQDSLITVLMLRDSLHREHMRRCSFISVEQVYTDKNGYLKLKRVPRPAK